MEIRFVKISETHHTLSVHRTDGSEETVTCETKSLLDHDLIHLAVESEAQLSLGFWGTVARGATIASLGHDVDDRPDWISDDDLWLAETLVGVTTGVLKSTDNGSGLQTAREYLEQTSPDAAAYLTETFFENVAERVRRLRGHWNATKFGETMLVTWEG